MRKSYGLPKLIALLLACRDQKNVGAMKYEVFDERRCTLGEGPCASGDRNQMLSWVDILGKRVYTRNLETGEPGEIHTTEQVSFAIPRTRGGFVLGLANGPALLDIHGGLDALPGRATADQAPDEVPTRWNDAKVAPNGELWLGSMTYGLIPGKSALYRMSRDGREIVRVLGNLTISNGLGWSPSGDRMFFIDSPKQVVSVFDVDGSEIANERTLVDLGDLDGMPDGLCVDAEGGIWVGFWEGSAIRRYDGVSGALTEMVRFAASRITSCAFAGPTLTQLFVTSARDEIPDRESSEAGMTFVVESSVAGLAVRAFES